jgi:hypothetical protein
MSRPDRDPYVHFVDYTCFVTVMPFADDVEHLPAFLAFFTRWMELAEQRSLKNFTNNVRGTQ